jgi:hypothetical protein
MNAFWNRPTATASIQPVMEIATSRMVVLSHWLSTNKHVKIGLAITLPGVVLLLFTTPITNKLAQAWGRTTEKASPEEETVRSESTEHGTNDTPPELPKKSYGQLSSGKRAARSERSERDTNDTPPELSKNSHESIMSRKRPTRTERIEPGVNNKKNILFNNNTNTKASTNSRPESPTKSYADAAAATPTTPIAEPFSPLTPDSASVNSESSSEHSRKEKFRFGKNIKKRWQNGPFGHGHGSSESPLSP